LPSNADPSGTDVTIPSVVNRLPVSIFEAEW
jgi:hypothetical protein